MQAKLSIILALCTLACILHSCKPSKPEGVLSERKMEDLLYDYHTAQGLARQMPADSIAFYTRLYQQAALSKHGLTQADFDHSLEWYERHTDLLSQIYESLAERLGDASAAHGAGAMIAAGGRSASGDTIDVWKGPLSVMLSSKGLNHFSFSQPADTAVQRGDIIEWSFRTDWYYHEGERTATACLRVHYAGDSIATTRQFVKSDNGRQKLTVRIADRPVERIECLVYQPAPWLQRPRLLNLTGFRLFRMRGQKPIAQPETQEERIDTAAKLPAIDPARRIRDSLLREDTLNRSRPHFR